MPIKLPFKLSHAAQATVAFLSAVAAIGTQILHDAAGFLPNGWTAVITSTLAVVAAIAGFIEKAEPLIGDLDNVV